MAAHPITLDPDLQKRLERVAEREVRSPEFVVRDALEMYFSACGEDQDITPAEDRGRDEFLAKADESLEHYRRTGLHVTWEEVDLWLSKLQAGEDAPLPACHV